MLEGKAPDAPFLNSNYDGSFIAGMAHLRYMYSMPVERIVKYFNENGFDMEKATAHGLLAKTETLFDGLYKALREAVKTDGYIAADETYHNVLLRDGGDRGIKKGYIWSTVAMGLGLAYFHYHDGSRRSGVFLDFIKGYKGTFQSDAYVTYKAAEGWYDRIGCFQHVKRKFIMQKKRVSSLTFLQILLRFLKTRKEMLRELKPCITMSIGLTLIAMKYGNTTWRWLRS